MGVPKPLVRTHSLVFVPTGAPAQSWHYDDKSRQKAIKHRYFTILVELCTPVHENTQGLCFLERCRCILTQLTVILEGRKFGVNRIVVLI